MRCPPQIDRATTIHKRIDKLNDEIAELNKQRTAKREEISNLYRELDDL